MKYKRTQKTTFSILIMGILLMSKENSYKIMLNDAVLSTILYNTQNLLLKVKKHKNKYILAKNIENKSKVY